MNHYDRRLWRWERSNLQHYVHHRSRFGSINSSRSLVIRHQSPMSSRSSVSMSSSAEIPLRVPCPCCGALKRRRFIAKHSDDDSSDSSPEPHSHEPQEFLVLPARRNVLDTLHGFPPSGSLWDRLLRSEKLMSPRSFAHWLHEWRWGPGVGVGVERFSFKYLSFDLRNMRDISDTPWWFTSMETPDLDDGPGGYFTRTKHEDVLYATGWHITRISNLVARNVDPLNAIPASNGILVDSGLRYGYCSHNGNSGVNFFTYFPTDMVSRGYVALKVDAIHGTKLKGGSRCRLCSRGLAGEIATTVAVRSVVFLWDDVWPQAAIS